MDATTVKYNHCINVRVNHQCVPEDVVTQNYKNNSDSNAIMETHR